MNSSLHTTLCTRYINALVAFLSFFMLQRLSSIIYIYVFNKLNFVYSDKSIGTTGQFALAYPHYSINVITEYKI